MRRGPIKLLEPCDGDPAWGFTSWCGGSCSIHTPWRNISIHYPKGWAGRWWFPDLVKLSHTGEKVIRYRTKTIKQKYIE